MTEEKITAMRHSLSHILAAAVKSIYGEVKFGIGPTIENGFYYDIDFGDTKVSDANLGKIEKKMRGIIAQGCKMARKEVSRAEALKWAKDNAQPYKTELINELPENETITFYDIVTPQGKVLFSDLCRGPHIDDFKEIGVFQLTSVAGAYWRGDEKREMLTRIYGVAFATKTEMDEYIQKQAEAKARDHRKLGKELDLFHFSDLVGSGLPLFTPRGTILRDLLNDFAQGYRLRCGYQKVCIPHIATVDLYKKSGHFQKFPEMFKFISDESGDELAIKPVSCPHHSQIFASVPRSYKELPIKYLETTMVYRDERKGEMGGLARVRSITQDDSHIFCTEDQVADVFGELIESAKDLYARIDMKLRLRLSFRDDGDGYIGDKKMWNKAEAAIKSMADKFEMDYHIGEGEAAMYGPKMDFMAIDALGREWQLATVQLDYALPQRFELEYTDKDGKKKTPIMVHCALVGSIERFMSIFIEHTGGWFPFWSAPEQVRIVTVNDTVSNYVKDINDILDEIELKEPVGHNKLRYSADSSAGSLGKKIRRAVDMKIPMIIVVGPKDMEAGEVSIRLRDREEKVKLDKLAQFIHDIATQ